MLAERLAMHTYLPLAGPYASTSGTRQSALPYLADDVVITHTESAGRMFARDANGKAEFAFVVIVSHMPVNTPATLRDRAGLVAVDAMSGGRWPSWPRPSADTVYLHLYDVTDTDHIRLLGREVLLRLGEPQR